MKNRTIYNLQNYKTIQYYKAFAHDAFVNKLLAITVFMWVGVRLVIQDNQSVLNWVFVSIPIVIMPLMFFVYPAIKPSISYKKVMKMSQGKEVKNDINFGKTELTCLDTFGNKIVVKYDSITRIDETNKLIVIKGTKIKPVYCIKDGFIDCTADEVVAFLKPRCMNLIGKKK